MLRLPPGPLGKQFSLRPKSCSSSAASPGAPSTRSPPGPGCPARPCSRSAARPRSWRHCATVPWPGTTKTCPSASGPGSSRCWPTQNQPASCTGTRMASRTSLTVRPARGRASSGGRGARGAAADVADQRDPALRRRDGGRRQHPWQGASAVRPGHESRPALIADFQPALPPARPRAPVVARAVPAVAEHDDVRAAAARRPAVTTARIPHRGRRKKLVKGRDLASIAVQQAVPLPLFAAELVPRRPQPARSGRSAATQRRHRTAGSVRRRASRAPETPRDPPRPRRRARRRPW